MDRIATPNLLVLCASLFLWTFAVQATLDGPTLWPSPQSARSAATSIEIAVDQESVYEPAARRAKGARSLEDAVMTAASGHWF